MAFRNQERDCRDISIASTEAGCVVLETFLITIVEDQRDAQRSRSLPCVTPLCFVRRALGDDSNGLTDGQPDTLVITEDQTLQSSPFRYHHTF